MTRIIRLERGEKKECDGVTQRHNQLFTMGGKSGRGRRKRDVLIKEGFFKKKPSRHTLSESLMAEAWCLTLSDDTVKEREVRVMDVHKSDGLSEISLGLCG